MFTSMELILLPQHTAAEEQLIFNSAHPLCLPTSDYNELSGWMFLHPCVCFTVNPYPDDVNLLDDKMIYTEAERLQALAVHFGMQESVDVLK